MDAGRDRLAMGSSPTLAHINRKNSRSAKRIKRDSAAHSSFNQSSSDDDLSGSVFQHSSAIEHLSRAYRPEGTSSEGDILSASFKSLYKSLFSHSVSSGEYLNPPPLPPPTSTELSSSDPKFPLEVSTNLLLSSVNPSNYNPHFFTLMDSFRDIAETNNWDRLEPEQVLGLVESFRAAEPEEFGLDAESYSRVSSSFENFFQQLNSRLGNQGNLATDLEEYQSDIPGSAGSAAQPLLSPPYQHDPDSMFPISGATPPNYPPPSMSMTPPSPPHDSVSPQSFHHVTSETTQLLHHSAHSPHQHRTSTPHHRIFPAMYNNMEQCPSVDTAARLMVDVPTKPSTGAFDDDDDDFDWSKLM